LLEVPVVVPDTSGRVVVVCAAPRFI